jgi:glycerol-3-phosphate acyltransferase PlsY
MLHVVLALVVGYGLGSIPFGLLLTRLAGTGDLRSIGSGNIGATNVLRTGRKDLAAATLLLDALKGTAAVLLCRHFGGFEAGMAAGLGAFLGHLFPVWLGFRGGKGVATFLGVTLGIWWPAFLVAAAVWLGVAVASRYSSLAALTASAVTPFVFLFVHLPGDALLFAVMAVLLWWKHAPNIARLRAGTESRIGGKA